MSKTNVTKTAAFGLALLKKEVAAKPGKNVLISPLSISLALGMTANGARGTTLDGITSTLGIENDQASNNVGYAALLEQLKRAGIGVTLDVANAIFARAGVGFKPEFLEANKSFFGARVDELDFSDPKTVDTINSFVSDSTNEKIPTLLDAIAADTVMFLINCVYFKGEWTEKFDKDDTQDLAFATPEGSKDLPTMYRNGDMIYGKDYDDNIYQYVSLPFGDSKAVRMLVYLPGADKTVDDVLAALDEAKLLSAATQDYDSEGTLRLPRIDITYENSLNDSLQALGMSQAFGDADFSGMRQTPPALFIQEVKHKTMFKVDEEGAEGAAVTSVSIGIECVRMPFMMNVDRPFVTFVVDSETNAVLFAGVINDPSK